MSISYWTRPALAHGKRLYLPVGGVINMWGNSLYDTRYRWAGVVLFICGLVLVVRGRHAWRGFGQGWRAPAEARGWLKRTFRIPEWLSRWLHGTGQTSCTSRWEWIKFSVWGLVAIRCWMHPFTVGDRVIAAPGRLFDHGADAATMLALAVLFPFFTRWIEPKHNQLQRLAARAYRAMASRTLANFSAFGAVAVLLYTLLASLDRDTVRALPALTVTIGLATVVATHKMWARYRKLCTQAHKDIQTLIRALEKPVGDDPLANQPAILEAWDAVERDLLTRVDTGYMFGARFVPRAVTAAIGEAVERSCKERAGQQGAREQVLVDLRSIQDVCGDHLDSVA
ncbi:hypothetical protein [Streptomyces xanthophaeus]|uniref:hypothetical protein n=1 Tax=Streptomyces xanthophaeus TaxID=67385 RepID=UPI0026475D0B|nr:hypothetical protein [Streptomyces xanthophaeus]WKD31179.1 hypothetical protein KO717_03845 [Streptomyces xanthophaeus]